VAELGIVGKVCVIGCPDETFDKAIAQVVICALPGMHVQHARLPATGLGEARRAAEYLGPVTGQSFDVLGMAQMRERVTQHGILQAPLVVRRGQREERRLAAGEFEQ